MLLTFFSISYVTFGIVPYVMTEVMSICRSVGYMAFIVKATIPHL
jgi:hypothetical protein